MCGEYLWGVSRADLTCSLQALLIKVIKFYPSGYKLIPGGQEEAISASQGEHYPEC